MMFKPPLWEGGEVRVGMGLGWGWDPLLFAAVSNFYGYGKTWLRFISYNQDLLMVESGLRAQIQSFQIQSH